MPPTHLRITVIDQMNAEWRTLGRSPGAVRALHQIARRNPSLADLVLGAAPENPGRCPTPSDLLMVMAAASGTDEREQAAAVVRVLLRESGSDALVPRILLQALIPGMLHIAARLRWGRGGAWPDGSSFFTELISVTWEVISGWAGQDRPYAVLDLLSAARCRIRRQLFKERDLSRRTTALTPDLLQAATTSSESALEELTRSLIALHQSGTHRDDVAVVYAQHVLGYSISELAAATGRDRRALYARRDRGQRQLCA